MTQFLPQHMSIGNPEDEALCHAKYASTIKGVFVEIGVLKGDTSKIICDHSIPGSKIYGIDPIIPDSMNMSLIGNINEIKQKTKKHDYTFIQDYSYNVVKTWNVPIDYLFIDGSHIYEDVVNDFESWFPFVNKNGIILIHDSAANRKGPYWWDGPSKLADSLIFDSRVEYLETIFCLTVFKKK
jgi:hypothetical protein